MAEQQTQSAARTEWVTPPELTAIQAVTVSPTLMTLLIKSNGEYFKKNRVTCAQESGFKWSPRHVGINALALLDRDLGEPLAIMKVNGGAEALGRLSAIEVHFDPEQSPIEWQAGTRLTNACAKFAELMDGFLCDDLGGAISDEGRKALAENIDSVMMRRRKEARPPRIPTADGKLRVAGPLSFIAEYRTKRDAYIEERCFECEPEKIYEGDITGLRMAREMLDYMRRHKTSRLMVYDILEDAFESVIGEEKFSDGASRRNVLRGFMDVIQGMLEFAARNANYSGWIEQKIDSEQEGLESWRKIEAEERAGFVARMKAAKAAKKAQQAVPA